MEVVGFIEVVIFEFLERQCLQWQGIHNFLSPHI